MKKYNKIMITVLSAAAVLLSGTAAACWWPAFGGKASDKDKKNYASRTEYFDGKVFRNEHEFKVLEKVPDGTPGGILSTKGSTPKDDIPLAVPNIASKAAKEDVTVTWLGHSSLVIQMHGLNIMIDPVFSKRASPVSFAGNKRFSDLPMTIDGYPGIDILIISHDHYDHLDYKTLQALDNKVKQYIVPLGVENHLESWGIDPAKITNMAWWEEVSINGLTIGCTPSRHYTGRGLGDRFATLWASWVFKDENHLIYESGDSGYDTHYKEIHDKYGDFDFVLIDCAQYNLHWPSVHQNPEEAFRGVQDLGCKEAMPIHWGTFKLARHPWDDPVVRMVKASEGTDVKIVTPMMGATMNIVNATDYQTRWYENIR